MKSNAKTVFFSALIGSTIAFFPYLLDALSPPDPKKLDLDSGLGVAAVAG